MATLPEPVERDIRICFSIYYFQTERDADVYATHVRKEGYTYNGGWYHGRPCGRDPSWDYNDGDLRKYAVTC